MPRSRHSPRIRAALIERAAEVAQRFNNDVRAHAIGAVAVRRDGAIVSARNGPSQTPEPCVHAEYRVLRKAGWGAEVFVARMRKDGSLGMAKPCEYCAAALTAMGALVWYSNDEGRVVRL